MGHALISLEYVRMAIRRTRYLRLTQAIAVSQPYAPIKGRGDELLHGACYIVSRPEHA